jgi:Protein of unknown function (DUF2889)
MTPGIPETSPEQTSSERHGSGIRDPLREVPALQPAAFRRTMHVDVGPAAAWSVRGRELELSGAARDVRGEVSGSSEVAPVKLREARISAKFDSARVLVALAMEPQSPWARSMVGQRAGSGFRKFLDETTPNDPEASLVRQLLEDLPAAALISGYSSLRLARRLGASPQSLTPPGVLERMTDLCSGWRAGGGAVLSVAAGEGVPIQDTPVAPDLSAENPDAWHAIPVLEADWMRRRRLVDVLLDVQGIGQIWAMFRDTVGESDGSELVLHEYAVTGTIHMTQNGLVLDRISADPRVLPFVECPAAAAEVVALEGMALRDLPRRVPEALFSVASCTHLNDLLRNIGGIAPVLEPV